MDQAVIKYYRKLLETRFENAGSIANPSIFLDSVGDKLLICGSTGDFMQLYINVVNNRIEDIKYTCVCDPTANVAVEILCTLVKGKTFDEAAVLTERPFFQFLGSEGEELQKKAIGLVEFLNKGITRYKAPVSIDKLR